MNIMIVVDVNVLSCVFDKNNERHDDFKPVNAWLMSRKGKLAYGGSHYLNELAKMPRYLKVVNELNRSGIAVNINKGEIDNYEKYVISAISDKKCNDPHVIALLAVSRSRILCSADAKSYRYIKDKRLYPKNFGCVRVYSGLGSIDVLGK